MLHLADGQGENKTQTTYSFSELEYKYLELEELQDWRHPLWPGADLGWSLKCSHRFSPFYHSPIRTWALVIRRDSRNHPVGSSYCLAQYQAHAIDIALSGRKAPPTHGWLYTYRMISPLGSQCALSPRKVPWFRCHTLCMCVIGRPFYS